MMKTLLMFGGWQDCGDLITSALANEWRVIHALLFEDIAAALEQAKIDLVLLAGCSARHGWEQIAHAIWIVHPRTPVVAVAADCTPEAIVSSSIGDLGRTPPSLPQNPVPENGTIPEQRNMPTPGLPSNELISRSLTPTLTLLERIPSTVTAGIARALRLIESRYNEPLTLADAAKAACYSRCHFSKLFTEQIGLTFVAYLSRVRIRHAVEILSESDKPITDIAYDVGFNDLSHFERVFRGIHKQSPSQFRQKSKNSQSSYKYPPSLAKTAVA